MRSCSAESRMLFDEAQQHRGRFDQLGLAAALREQVGAGAGDDHFADEIDQLVELVGMHADHARFVRLLLADDRLSAGGGFDDSPSARPSVRRGCRRSASALPAFASRSAAAVRDCAARPASSSACVSAPERTRISPRRMLVFGEFVDQLQVFVDLGIAAAGCTACIRRGRSRRPVRSALCEACVWKRISKPR
jgi:hypothetical protein